MLMTATNITKKRVIYHHFVTQGITRAKCCPASASEAFRKSAFGVVMAWPP